MRVRVGPGPGRPRGRRGSGRATGLGAAGGRGSVRRGPGRPSGLGARGGHRAGERASGGGGRRRRRGWGSGLGGCAGSAAAAAARARGAGGSELGHCGSRSPRRRPRRAPLSRAAARGPAAASAAAAARLPASGSQGKARARRWMRLPPVARGARRRGPSRGSRQPREGGLTAQAPPSSGPRTCSPGGRRRASPRAPSWVSLRRARFSGRMGPRAPRAGREPCGSGRAGRAGRGRSPPGPSFRSPGPWLRVHTARPRSLSAARVEPADPPAAPRLAWGRGAEERGRRGRRGGRRGRAPGEHTAPARGVGGGRGARPGSPRWVE